MEDGEVIKEFINPRHRKRILTAKWEIIIPEGEPYVIVKPRQEGRLTPHDLLLYATIDALSDKIEAYKADRVEYPGLKKLNMNLMVGTKRIDLITKRGGALEFWEIKTARELGEDRTREQLLEYAQHLQKFNLVTSEDGVKNAKEIIRLLGLKDKVKLWVVKPRLGEATRKSQLINIPIT